MGGRRSNADILKEQMVKEKDKDAWWNKKKIVKVEPDLQALRSLIGKYSGSSILAKYGLSTVGKTSLDMLLAMEYSHKTGLTSLVYDTEGGVDEFVEHWSEVYREKYPDGKIEVRLMRSWEKVLNDFGYYPTVSVSEKGKMTVASAPRKRYSDMAKYVMENQIGFISFDSLTQLMTPIGTAQQNLPARNTIQSMIFDSLLDLQDRFKTVITMNNHASKNPMVAQAKAKMVGGKAVSHNCKWQIEIKRVGAKGCTNYRRLVLERSPVKPAGQEGLCELTDEGYLDRSSQDYTTANEAAKNADG